MCEMVVTERVQCSLLLVDVAHSTQCVVLEVCVCVCVCVWHAAHVWCGCG